MAPPSQGAAIRLSVVERLELIESSRSFGLIGRLLSACSRPVPTVQQTARFTLSGSAWLNGGLW
jgi:hypothetical protein